MSTKTKKKKRVGHLDRFFNRTVMRESLAHIISGTERSMESSLVGTQMDLGRVPVGRQASGLTSSRPLETIPTTQP